MNEFIIFAWFLALLVIAAYSKPNVVFVLLDDLGFTDTSYYADTNDEFYGTAPALDRLSENGVKFNYHYSESTCSPSRAAFLTGRYSFRNGLDQALVFLTNKAINEKYPVLPELMRDAGYNTFMSGKWHVGSNNVNNIPPGKGFDESIYYNAGNVDPFRRVNGASFPFTYQAVFQPLLQNTNTPPLTMKAVGELLTKYQPYVMHDFHKNMDDKYLMNNLPEYVDTTFNNEALNYLTNYNDDKPFFMYIPFQSPHSPIVDPCASPLPGILPPPCDSTTKFAECEKVTNEGRKNLCRMIADSGLKIEAVIDKLKEINEWDNTVLIVVSDNGAQNNFLGNFGSNALAWGQNLPFRGAKVSAFEGGIRTPAILSGGYIDINYPDLKNCEYSDLIYIADWFNIILSGFAGVDTTNLDIDSMNLLDHINYVCGDNKDVSSSSSSDEYQAPKPKRRKEIISFRYCDPNKFQGDYQNIQAAWVRTKKYKLVINGSYAADCGLGKDSPLAQIFKRQGLYMKYDGFGTSEPDQDSYINSQKYNENSKLYKSRCYDKYLKDPTKNPIDTIQKEFMLFNIKKDKIEACNIADENPDIVQELYAKISNEIENGNVEATGSQFADPSAVPLGRLYAVYKDFQCPRGIYRTWEELYAADGSPDSYTIINDVYNKVSTCQAPPYVQVPAAKTVDGIYKVDGSNNNHNGDGDDVKIRINSNLVIIICGIIIVLFTINLILCFYTKLRNRNNIKYNKVVSNVIDTDTDV